MCHTSTTEFLGPCLLVITWLPFVKRVQPMRVHPQYMYTLPHLTAQQTLLRQNLDDGDDHGL